MSVSCVPLFRARSKRRSGLRCSSLPVMIYPR
jgi:hypothetical protein